MKKNSNGEYLWINGVRGLNASWAKGQPNRVTGDCVALKNGKQESVSCQKPMAFICEGRPLRLRID
jgi:hypothetical protein